MAGQRSLSTDKTAILDRQTALAELTLRKELFDDRLAVYQATYSFLAALLRDGFQAKRIKFSDAENAFLDAKERATFLFRPAVSKALQELWAAKVQGDILELEMDRARPMKDEKFMENHTKSQEIRGFIREQFEHVADIFGDEMKLSDHGEQGVPTVRVK